MKKAAILGLLAIGAALCQQPIASPIVIGGAGSGGGDTFASVSLKTTSYSMAAGIGDCYVPFVFTGTGNNTFTLLATPPSTNCQLSVQNNSSGTLTVPPTSGFAGGVIAACADGGLCPVSVIKTNGTTWYGTLPGGSGTTVSAAPPYLVIGGSSYLPFGFLATQPPTAGWTPLNFTGATFVTSGQGGALSITTPLLGSLAVAAQTRAIGATSTLIAVVGYLSTTAGTASNCGIGISSSGSSNLYTDGLYSGSTSTFSAASHWTSPTAHDFDTDSVEGAGSVSYLKMTYSGGTATSFVSIDGGAIWHQIDQRTGFTGYDSWIFYNTGSQGGATRCNLYSLSIQ